jgi:HK97 family phage major capsid protein
LQFSIEEIRQALSAERSKRARLVTELDGLQARVRTSTADHGTHERIANVRTGIGNADSRVEELESELADVEDRTQRLTELAQRPGNREEGADFSHAGRPPDGDRASATLDGALRTIERHSNEHALRSEAADRLERLVRSADPLGLDARYLEAVGDPSYNSAFGKMLADPLQGQLRFTPEETAAVQAVSQVEAQRGLVTGTGSAGGFAIPFTLDPSIMLSSSGALNPVRQIARVITIGTHDWKGVSSDGVTASYDAEASEVSDDTPVLAQPTVVTAMGRAFVPFSIELGQDWATLQLELEKLIADGRDVLDATKFLTGSGTDEPAGVLTGLTTTQRVQTATTAIYAVGDGWALKAAIPSRYIANTTYAAAPATWDATYRFVGTNSAEPPQLPTREGPFLGQPKVEWSTLVTTTTTGSKIIVAGDFAAGFVIADRIGMTAEIVQHLFGANRRPTGERGLFAYWRTGSKVVVPNAFRYLEVK